MPCRRNEWQLDSGQVLIDKRGQNGMNLAALLAAAKMQEDHSFWFKISGGVSRPILSFSVKEELISVTTHLISTGQRHFRESTLETWSELANSSRSQLDPQRYGFYALGIDYTPAPHALTAYGCATKGVHGQVLIGTWLSSLSVCALRRNMHAYETEGHTFCGLVMLQHSLSPMDWQHYPSAKPSAALAASHAPPLFVHANLLKHSSGYQRGKFLTHVKYWAEDRTDRPSDRARSIVYTSRQGMCVDLWDAFDDIDPRVEGNAEGNYENGQIRIESSPRAFGGVLDGFEEM